MYACRINEAETLLYLECIPYPASHQYNHGVLQLYTEYGYRGRQLVQSVDTDYPVLFQFFYAPLIAVYCAYLWRLENFNRNRNALLAAPVPIPCLYLAQFLAISCVTLLTQLWVGVLFLICGLITGLQGFPPLDTIIWLLRGCVGGLAIAALQLFFSSFIRSFALPIAMALLGSVAGLLFSSAGFGLFSLIPSCFWE